MKKVIIIITVILLMFPIKKTSQDRDLIVSHMRSFNFNLADYNKCLNDLQSSITKGLHRIATITELGEDKHLECNFCERPDLPLVVKWKMKRIDQVHSEIIYPDSDSEKYTFIRSLGVYTLVIHDTELNDEGHYWCEIYGKTELTDIHLTVVEAEPKMPYYQHAKNPKLIYNYKKRYEHKIEELNLKVFIEWSEWNQCSTCGQPGYKMMIGTCFINILDEYGQTNITRDHKILDKYKHGVPCRSSLLSRDLRNHPRIRSTKGGKMYENCMIPCLSLDSKTNNKNDINNKSMLSDVDVIKSDLFDPLKEIELPKDMLIVKEQGERLVLLCVFKLHVSNLVTHDKRFQVVWQQNGNVLHQNTISIESKNRIRISQDRKKLYIVGLVSRDSGVYSCSVSDRIKNIYRVKVIRKISLGVSVEDLTVYAGTFLTCFTLFLLLIYSICSKLSNKKV